MPLAHHGAAAGSASALFGLGALLAPLAGVAGNHEALPMGIVIAAWGLGTLAIDRLHRDPEPLNVALEPTP